MKKYAIFLFLCVIIEIFVFNFNSLETITCRETLYSVEDYIVTNVEIDETVLHVMDNEASIEINNINKEIKSIYVDVLSTELTKNNEFSFELFYKDKTTSNYMEHSEMNRRLHSVYTLNERSKFIPCNFIGESEGVKLVFKDMAEEDLPLIKNIIINKPIPFNYINSLLRVLILFLFLYLVDKIKQTNNRLLLERREKTILNCVSLFFGIIIIFVFLLSNIFFYGDLSFTTYYTKSFIDALLQGNISLLEEPPIELLNMKDPYDFSARQNLGIDCYWDTVYFNGKYYQYFGILPALLIFLPFKMITGLTLSCSFVCVIFNILLCIQLCNLYYFVVKKWFKDVPFSLSIFGFILLLFGSKILWITARAQIYEMILSVAMFFAVSGLNYCLKSNLFDKNLNLNSVNYKYLGLGCSCLALSVACRPTELLISLIILPSLVKLLISWIKDIKITKKMSWKFVVSVILPYFIVGLSLMIYNYVRFGSVFEFGTSYQLTVTNNGMMGFSLKRCFMGLWSMLFSIPIFNFDFPFIHQDLNALPYYQGKFFNVNIGGSLIATTIIPIILFLLPCLYKDMKKNKMDMWKFIKSCLFVGVLMLAFASGKMGNSGRYLMDCSWLIILVSICVLFYIYQKINTNEIMQKIFINSILGITILSVFINFMLALSGENDLMYILNKGMFYNLKYFFSFWM